MCLLLRRGLLKRRGGRGGGFRGIWIGGRAFFRWWWMLWERTRWRVGRGDWFGSRCGGSFGSRGVWLRGRLPMLELRLWFRDLFAMSIVVFSKSMWTRKPVIRRDKRTYLLRERSSSGRQDPRPKIHPSSLLRRGYPARLLNQSWTSVFWIR